MAENEYIKKAQVKRAFRRLLNDEGSANEIFQSAFEYGVNLAWLKIENMHAADVAPVKHGFWGKETLPFKDTQGVQHFGGCCSNCGAILDRTKFCGECGAKMDGKED